MKYFQFYLSHRIVITKITILFLISSFNLNSQNLKFDHFTTINGLPNNEVRKISIDSLGYLWFGTSNGISRFDGYRFKTYQNIPTDNNSIVGNRVFSMEASKDKIWLGTLNGLSIISSKSMKVIKNDKLSKLTGNKIILTLYVDNKNRTWLANENQNFIINSETYESREILKNHQIVCIDKGLNNYYWIGTNKSLLKYDAEKDIIIKSYNIGQFSSYSNDAIFIDSYGVIWLTFQSGIYRYEPTRDRFIRIFELSGSNNMTENRNGSLYFGSYGNGLVKYDRATGTFESIKADPAIHSSISSNDVYDVYTAPDGSVWVGTQEGLDLFDFSRNRFKSLQHYPNKLNSLRSNFVQAIYAEDSLNFWLGLRNGIDKLTFTKGSDSPIISHFDGISENFKILNDTYVTDILKDSKKRYWVATEGAGLFLFTEKNTTLKRFTHSSKNISSIGGNNIRNIFEDQKGRIWYATNNGISQLEDNNNGIFSFKNIGEIINKNQTLQLKDVYKILQDSKGRIWIGMNQGGLALLNDNGNKKFEFNLFKYNSTDNNSLSNNEVFVIFEDSRSRIWVGTSGNGLNLLMEDKIIANQIVYYFKRYNQQNGLSDNEIDAVLEDDDSNLWIATNNGLSKFNLDNETFTNFTAYDGILKGKFRKNAAFKSEDGTLFFGGAAGINYFQPNNFNTNTTVPNPIFTNLLIDDKPIHVNEKIGNQIIINEILSTGSTITLPTNENRFSLEFSALSYTSPLRNQYKYKLEGFDKDWKYLTGDNPRVSYSNLPWGKYRFSLTASNNDGVWNTNPIYVNINVKYSLFTTTSIKFIGSVLFVLVIFFGLIIFKRRKKIKEIYSSRKIVEKKKKIVDPQVDIENKSKVELLHTIMIQDELYLDSNLNLKGLSSKLDISQNHLSFLLNDYVGKSFYDYVNQYRIEDACKRLVNPKYDHQTMSSIGLDCGFNSKSAYNRIFKNHTGKTPSEYKKSMKK